MRTAAGGVQARHTEGTEHWGSRGGACGCSDASAAWRSEVCSSLVSREADLKYQELHLTREGRLRKVWGNGGAACQAVRSRT